MSEQEYLKQENVEQPLPPSRLEERRARRAARRADREAAGFGWIAGLVFIAVGVLYLLNQLDILPAFTNWWALFLLLPGLGVLSAAYAAYRRSDGRWTGEVTGLFLLGMFFVGLTAVFLFNLNYGWLMPLFLIAAGLILLFRPYIGGTPQ